jgi:hypothetical protein
LNNSAHILSSFEPITLAEMDSVKLMDRTDTKFTFSTHELPTILEQLKTHYRVLSINDNLTSTYKTLYFDTPDFDIYSKHHNGRLNRYKIRYRNYVESQLGFLEVKFKNNKGRTLKERIKQNSVPIVWTEKSVDFITKKTPYHPDLLMPVIWVNYGRITLVDKAFKERVTIDINLEFNNSTSHRKMEGLVIAEVKQAGKGQSSAIKLFKQKKIRSESISKYCLGITSIYPLIKSNNFKQKLTQLNKILNDNSIKFASNF